MTAPASNQSSSRNGADKTSAALTILVVEDNPDDARLIAEMLKKVQGYRVLNAERLSDGLAQMRAEKVDAILLDLALPDMHGLDGLVPLRKAAPYVPIVILTARQDDALALTALQSGADDYLIKGEIAADLLARSLRYAFQRKEVERTLALSEQRYRALVENSLGLICTHDVNGTLLSVNTTATMLGYQPHELIGKNLRDFLTPDSRDAFSDYMRRIRQNGRDSGMMSLVDRAGSEHAFAYNNVILDQGGTPVVIGYAHDITDRARVEQALRDSDARFRLLASRSPVGIVTADEHGDYTFVNERWRRMAGLALDKALGQGWVAALHPDDKEAVLHAWRESVREARECSLEFRFRAEDGRVTWVSASSTVQRDSQERITGYLCFVVDTSDRRQNEEALRQLSLKDELTGLYNRRGFVMHGDQFLKLAKRSSAQCMLLCIGVGGMKEISDKHGHLEGDHARVTAAVLLRRAARESDVVARLGDDKFAIVLMSDEPETGAIIQRRLDRMLTEHNGTSSVKYPLTMSVEITRLDPLSTESIEPLLVPTAKTPSKQGRRGV